MSLQNKQIVSDVADRFNEFAIRYNDALSGDPGTGFFGMDALDPASVTAMRVSYTDLDGNDISEYGKLLQSGEGLNFIASIGSGNLATTTKYHRFTVSGAITDNTTYITIPLTYIGHVGSGQTLADDDRVFMQYGGVGGSSGGSAEYVEQHLEMFNAVLTWPAAQVYYFGDRTLMLGIGAENNVQFKQSTDRTLRGAVLKSWKSGGTTTVTNAITMDLYINAGATIYNIDNTWVPANTETTVLVTGLNQAVATTDVMSLRGTAPGAWGGTMSNQAYHVTLLWEIT